MGNIKLRALNFEHVMGVNMTIIYINFQMNLQVSLKDMSNLLNIAPNELKLVLWINGGEVTIPTKFEGNMEKLNFL